MSIEKSLKTARRDAAISDHVAQMVMDETMANKNTSFMDAMSVRHGASQGIIQALSVLERLGTPIPEDIIFNSTADGLHSTIDSSRTVARPS